jgi:hypothetical protein
VELVLSVVPVESSTSVPVPFWTPPEVPELKVVEAVVTRLPSGIVPVAFTATPPKRVACVGLVKPFVQVETVEKSSVYVPVEAIDTGVCAKAEADSKSRHIKAVEISSSFFIKPPSSIKARDSSMPTRNGLFRRQKEWDKI